ncbi:hypothetical protein COV56_03675 [Candidatus Kuenenbacteria bacterium CG11_big_fil_rev_8_21_14_0_20_37_9]|nr:MAG: hypothetical protein COV56_03675 [Candidatus Kuenenbacteria bacterium CG11_big_fil_rev_8_21_14_0_20_37_9]
MYDIIIIGGGPAGVAAGIYAARKKMDTLFIAENFSGQSVVSHEIENWIGVPKISGFLLAKNLEIHLRAQKNIEIKSPERARKIKEKDGNFIVETDKSEYETRTVIICIGSRRRRLNIPGEKEYAGKGIAYCSTCDAPLFKGKQVVVIGSGNASLEAVKDLINYAKEIHILNRSETIRGDAVSFEKIKKAPNFKGVINNAIAKEVRGGIFVEKLVYTDTKKNIDKDLSVQGIFVEIGSIPNIDITNNLVKLNHLGEIIVDHKTSATSKLGIYAAGDVTDSVYKQNNISAGDGVKAALSACDYLKRK